MGVVRCINCIFKRCEHFELMPNNGNMKIDREGKAARQTEQTDRQKAKQVDKTANTDIGLDRDREIFKTSPCCSQGLIDEMMGKYRSPHRLHNMLHIRP